MCVQADAEATAYKAVCAALPSETSGGAVGGLQAVPV